MRARRLLAASIGTLLAAGFVTVIASPAQAFWAQSFSATGRAYTDSKLPTQSFVNVAGDVPLGAWSDTAGAKHRSRAYYTFDISRYAGKVISKADIVVKEASAADCATAQPVELWRTDAITSTTSWNDPPRRREQIGVTSAGGPDATCPGYLVWDARTAVQRAAKRGDTTFTVELRVPREFEGDLTHGRKLKPFAAVDLEWNTAPVNGTLAVEYPVAGCTTRQDPVVVPPYQITLTHRWVDPDTNDWSGGAQFAAWPVGHEDQRIEAPGMGYGQTFSKIAWDMSRYPHGTVVAWTSRAYDGHDYSAWAKPCYVKVDAKAPPAPKVTSAQYPADGQPHTGEGLPGTFTFSSRNTKDVVGYYWGQYGDMYNYVAAPSPGADATMQFTPSSFVHRLSVQAVDKAGNRSPKTEYEFYVRSSAPYVVAEAVGLGLPGSTLDIYRGDPETTEFAYSIGGGPETRVPATVDGPTHVDVVFTSLGYTDVTVKAYAGTELIGASHQSVLVQDLPRIESADFDWPDVEGQVGRPGTFTFRPGRPDVVAYEYAFLYEDLQRVDAAADGTATLTWTPTEPNWYMLNVRSISADGTVSETNQFQFNVIDTKPAVYSDDYPYYRAGGGVGVPGEFTFDTAMPDASAYVYRLNDGAEQVVEIEWPYTSARVNLTPDHAGPNTLTVKTRFADGTFSPVREYRFQVSDAPVVTSTDYPEHNPAGRPGQAGDFTFRPGRPDTVAYRYSLGYGDEQHEVAAGTDGSATVRLAPQYSGYQTLTAVGVAADGTLTEERHYELLVRNPYVDVYSYYDSYNPTGGLGAVGRFEFRSELSEVTAFEYQVNGGAWQTVARDGGAQIEVTMDRNGENVLSVRGRDGAGVITPQTDYPFLVGILPRVTSTDYPAGGYAGGPGVAGVFQLLPGSPDVVEYSYQAGSADPVIVPADADGKATVVWAPPSSGYYTWYVRSHLADGVWSDYVYYRFDVNS